MKVSINEMKLDGLWVLFLWGFFLTMLFCGIEVAVILYGSAMLIGFIIGIRKAIKERD